MQGGISGGIKMFKHMQKKSKPDFGRNSGGGGKHFRGGATGLARDPHGKLGLRTGQSQRSDVCMSVQLIQFCPSLQLLQSPVFQKPCIKSCLTQSQR